MKFFLPLVFLIIGVGCVSIPQQQHTTLPVNDQEMDQQSDVVIEEPVSSSAAPSATVTELPPMTNSNRTINGQEDLAIEYSRAVLHTNLGDITVALFVDKSPKTVNNFLNLAKSGEYDGTKFHRIIVDFMIQGGDLLSKDDSKVAMWGTGGPNYRFEDEFNDEPLVRGSLAMANAGPNTNGSQFFIVTAPETPWLNGKHTNFGEVVEGMNVVETIEKVSTGPQDRPLIPIVVESVELVK